MFNEYENGITKAPEMFFMVVMSMKSDERNLVSFFFTFNDYKNETKKHLEAIFIIVMSMTKATNETRGHLTLCLESVKSEPNITLNLFHGFTSLKKRLRSSLGDLKRLMVDTMSAST